VKRSIRFIPYTPIWVERSSRYAGFTLSWLVTSSDKGGYMPKIQTLDMLVAKATKSVSKKYADIQVLYEQAQGIGLEAKELMDQADHIQKVVLPAKLKEAHDAYEAYEAARKVADVKIEEVRLKVVEVFAPIMKAAKAKGANTFKEADTDRKAAFNDAVAAYAQKEISEREEWLTVFKALDAEVVVIRRNAQTVADAGRAKWDEKNAFLIQSGFDTQAFKSLRERGGDVPATK
jgi:hypothetical protein